jgi:hypothetical protein
MSKSKSGSLNPMFNKPKSKEFIEQMFRDKTGANVWVTKSPETLAKLSKKVYVYDSNTKELVYCYDSYKSAVRV